MTNKIQIKRSTTSLTPPTNTLEHGELAIGQVGGITRLIVGNADKSNKTLIQDAEQLTDLLQNTKNTNGRIKGVSTVNGVYKSVTFVTTETINPTITDDETVGFIVGSLWYNNEQGKLWAAVDTGTGNAVWNLISSNSTFNYKGTLDASANPNYPASSVGDTYIISVAGKIGGVNGVKVEAGDQIFCKTETVSGDHATVGNNFNILQTNTDGAVISSSTSSTNEDIAVFDGTSGKIIKDSGVKMSTFSTPNTVPKRNEYGDIAINGIKKVVLELSADGSTTTLTQESATLIRYFDDIANSTLILPDAENENSFGREYRITNISSTRNITIQYIQGAGTFNIVVLTPHQEIIVQNRFGEYSFGSVVNLDDRFKQVPDPNTIPVRDENGDLFVNTLNAVNVEKEWRTFANDGVAYNLIANGHRNILVEGENASWDQPLLLILPDATTLPPLQMGKKYEIFIKNKSNRIVELDVIDTSLIKMLEPQTGYKITNISRATPNGVWDVVESDTPIKDTTGGIMAHNFISSADVFNSNGGDLQLLDVDAPENIIFTGDGNPTTEAKAIRFPDARDFNLRIGRRFIVWNLSNLPFEAHFFDSAVQPPFSSAETLLDNTPPYSKIEIIFLGRTVDGNGNYTSFGNWKAINLVSDKSNIDGGTF